MDELRVIELKESIFEDNNADADRLRGELKAKGTFFINLMSAPGSGKTTTLEQIIRLLGDKYSIGVLEADIDGAVDGERIRKLGIPCVQVHTGGMCHLDADMARQSHNGLGEDVEIAFLENIGNLVCPAEYDTGSHLNIMILSVTEGMDKPLKYPLMFGVVSAVIINKIDAISYFDFDVEKCTEYIRRHNKDARILPVSSLTGEGCKELAQWIEKQYLDWKGGVCDG